MIIPYLVTAGIIIVFYFILNKVLGKGDWLIWIKAALWGSGSKLHSSPLYGDYPSIGAIWFLLALFWCKLIFSILHSVIYNKFCLLLTCIILSIAASIIDNKIINLPLSILPGISALVFYVTGYILRISNFFINRTPSYTEIIILLLVWMAATFIPDRPLGMVTCDYPLYPLSVIGGIAATVIIYWGCKSVLNFSNIKPIKILLWFGEVSLTFLCLHLIDLNIPLRFVLGINNALTSIVFDLTFCIITTILLSQFSVSRNIFKLKQIQLKK